MKPAQILPLFLLAASLLAGCQKSEPPPAEAPKLALPELVPLAAVGPGVHQITVDMPPSGPTVRCTLSIPLGYNNKASRPLVVALHDTSDGTPFYGRGMIDAVVKPGFDSLGVIAVAPDALDGGDWTTVGNETAVVWLTQCLQKSYAIDAKKVLLTGFGKGSQGTWAIAGRHQDLFAAALSIAGGPAAGETSWKIPLYVIHSQNDEVVPLPPTQRSIEALKAKGANVELKVIAGVSHYQTIKFVGALREAIPWLKRAWGER